MIPAGFLVPHGTRVCHPEALCCFAYGAVTLYGRTFHSVQLQFRFLRRIRDSAQWHPTTPRILSLRATCIRRFRLIPVRSPLLRESLLLSFPEGTEMFHFPSFASLGYVLYRAMGGMTLHGFPHSDIPGSMPVSGSPRLFAAIHVLLRLPTPRHPSHALSSLTITSISFLQRLYLLRFRDMIRVQYVNPLFSAIN